MQTKYFAGIILLGAAFLKVGDVKAQQGAADSLLYRQAKLEIWCETMRFIYTDNKADSLLKTLKCQDWVAFDNSMIPNYLQSRNFYRSIEKPSVYSGYVTYNAKLQKLVDEIAKKLKSSPGRAADQNRIRKVDSLQASLSVIAAAPTSPISARQNTDREEEAIETSKINTITAVRQEAAVNTNSLDDNQMDWMEILQWALLLLLTGGLGYLWGQNKRLKKEMEVRMNRRKQEISAISRIKESDKPEFEKPKAVNEPKALTKPEVIRLVKGEIEKIREQQKARRQQVATEEKRNNVPDNQDEFNRQAGRNETKMDRVEEPEKGDKISSDGIFYDKLPFKGGFHQNHLSQQRHPDSIYSIQVLSGKPDEAEFWVTEDQEVQKYAMQNGLSFFEEACEYNQVEENPSMVRNIEKGKLRKNGHLWQIEKKVKVNFE